MGVATISITNILIAVFTGVTALVVVMTYHHVRFQAGLRRPIRVSSNRYHHPDDLVISTLPNAIVDDRPRHIATMRFSNKSDVDVRWSIDSSRTRLIFATRGPRPLIEDPGLIETPAHDGRSVALMLFDQLGTTWRPNEVEREFAQFARFKRRPWIRIRGFMTDGQKVKGWARVELYEIRR